MSRGSPVGPLRATDDGVVLAGLKAKPFGWPAASLDPGCGRSLVTLSGGAKQGGNHKIRSLRFQGIAVLAGVKTKPFGWPAASLDPGCGRRALHARGGGRPEDRNPKIRSLRFQGIA